MDIMDKPKIQGRLIKHKLSLFSILKGLYSSSILNTISTYKSKMNITKYKMMKNKIKRNKLHWNQMNKAFLHRF